MQLGPLGPIGNISRWVKTIQTKLNVGDYQFATCNGLLGVVWHHRRDVFLLSTTHNQSVTSVMKRPKGSCDKELVACPSCIPDYNLYMGGVDLSDQHLSLYNMIQHRTLMWWKKVFWRMIDIAVLNSWIIFHANFPESNKLPQRISHGTSSPVSTASFITESQLWKSYKLCH